MTPSFEEQAALRRRSGFVTPHAVVTDPNAGAVDPETLSWTERAAAMSANNFSAGIDAAQGVVQKALGFDEAANANFQEFGRLSRRAQQFGPEIQSWDDVEQQGVTAGNVGAYLGAQVANMVPDIGLALTGAGVGAMVGRRAAVSGARALATEFAESEAGKLAAREAAEATTKRLAAAGVADDVVAQNARMAGQDAARAAFMRTDAGQQAVATAVGRGQFVGATAAGVPSALNDERTVELAQQGDAADAVTLFAGGVAQATLDTLPFLRALDKIGGQVTGETVKKTADRFAKRFAKEVGTQALLEGSTELAQEAIKNTSHAVVTGNPELLYNDQALKNYIVSFATGAALGGALGGGIEAGGAAGRQAQRTARQTWERTKGFFANRLRAKAGPMPSPDPAVQQNQTQADSVAASTRTPADPEKQAKARERYSAGADNARLSAEIEAKAEELTRDFNAWNRSDNTRFSLDGFSDAIIRASGGPEGAVNLRMLSFVDGIDPLVQQLRSTGGDAAAADFLARGGSALYRQFSAPQTLSPQDAELVAQLNQYISPTRREMMESLASEWQRRQSSIDAVTASEEAEAGTLGAADEAGFAEIREAMARNDSALDEPDETDGAMADGFSSGKFVDSPYDTKTDEFIGVLRGGQAAAARLKQARDAGDEATAAELETEVGKLRTRARALQTEARDEVLGGNRGFGVRYRVDDAEIEKRIREPNDGYVLLQTPGSDKRQLLDLGSLASWARGKFRTNADDNVSLEDALIDGLSVAVASGVRIEPSSIREAEVFIGRRKKLEAEMTPKEKAEAAAAKKRGEVLRITPELAAKLRGIAENKRGGYVDYATEVAAASRSGKALPRAEKPLETEADILDAAVKAAERMAKLDGTTLNAQVTAALQGTDFSATENPKAAREAAAQAARNRILAPYLAEVRRRAEYRATADDRRTVDALNEGNDGDQIAALQDGEIVDADREPGDRPFGQRFLGEGDFDDNGEQVNVRPQGTVTDKGIVTSMSGIADVRVDPNNAPSQQAEDALVYARGKIRKQRAGESAAEYAEVPTRMQVGKAVYAIAQQRGLDPNSIVAWRPVPKNQEWTEVALVDGRKITTDLAVPAPTWTRDGAYGVWKGKTLDSAALGPVPAPNQQTAAQAFAEGWVRRRIESEFPPGQSSEQTRAQLLAAQLQPDKLIDTFRRIRRGEFDTGSVREQRAEEALPPGTGYRDGGEMPQLGRQSTKALRRKSRRLTEERAEGDRLRREQAARNVSASRTTTEAPSGAVRTERGGVEQSSPAREAGQAAGGAVRQDVWVQPGNDRADVAARERADGVVAGNGQSGPGPAGTRAANAGQSAQGEGPAGRVERQLAEWQSEQPESPRQSFWRQRGDAFVLADGEINDEAYSEALREYLASPAGQRARERYEKAYAEWMARKPANERFSADPGVESVVSAPAGQHDLAAEGAYVQGVIRGMGFGPTSVTVVDNSGAFASLPSTAGGMRVNPDGSVTIALGRDLVGLERLEVLQHEIGHVALFQHIAKTAGVELKSLLNADGSMPSTKELVAKLAETDPELHAALEADYKAWLSQNANKARGVNTMLGTRGGVARAAGRRARGAQGGAGPALRDMDQATVDELMSMEEWIADGVVRALNRNGTGRSLTEKFFDGLATALRAAYDKFRAAVDAFLGRQTSREEAMPQDAVDAVRGTVRGSNPPAPPSVQKWVDGMFNAEAKRLGPTVSAGRREILLRAADFLHRARHGLAPDPETIGREAPAQTYAHTVASLVKPWAQVMRYALTPEQRGILWRVLSRDDVTEKLSSFITEERGFDPAVREALYDADIGPELRIAMAFSMATQGSAPFGPNFNNAFNEAMETVSGWLGYASDADYAQAIMSAVQSGELNTVLVANRDGAETRAEFDHVKAHTDALRAAGKADAARKVERNERFFKTRFGQWMTKTREYYGRVVSQSIYDRAVDSGSTNVRRIVTALYKPGDVPGADAGLIRAAEHKIALESQKAIRALGSLSDAQRAEALGILQRATPASQIASATKDPEVAKAVEAIKAQLAEFDRYARQAGMQYGYQRDFFPVVMDVDNANAEAELGSLLSEPNLEPGVREFYDRLARKRYEEASPEERKARNLQPRDPRSTAELIEDMVQGAKREADFASSYDGEPRARGARHRSMDFVYKLGTPEQIARFAKLQSQDIATIMGSYIEPMTRLAEYERRFGGGRLERMLERAREEGASDDDIQMARAAVAAAMGTYGKDEAGSPVIGLVSEGMAKKLAGRGTQRVISNVMAYQNVRLLPLALLSSLTDPLLITLRNGGDLGNTLSGIRDGLRATFTKEGRAEMERMIEQIGAAADFGAEANLVYALGGMDQAPTARAVNDFLFRWNGMTGLAKATRYMALHSAHGFLARHALRPNEHSARYFRELGLREGDVQVETVLGVNGKGVERVVLNTGNAERDARVRQALVRFVDDAVLRPNPIQSPLWHADPYMGLVTQYKGFLYAMWDQMGRRMQTELGNGNLVGPFIALLAYAPLAVMAMLMREEVQYLGQGNPARAGWDAADYTAAALNNSGLLGPSAAFFTSIENDLSTDRLPLLSQLGPSFGQAQNVASSAVGERSGSETFQEAIPTQVIWEKWIGTEPNRQPTEQVDPEATEPEMGLRE